jgi:hypothetical protein
VYAEAAYAAHMTTATLSTEAPVDAAQTLADRYVAVWHVTDPAARRAAIAALWGPGGVHYVRTLEARGYDALEERVSSSHEKNVKTAGNSFRAKNALSLRNLVTFDWDMLSQSGEVEAVGFEILVLGDDGKIAADYQFVTR